VCQGALEGDRVAGPVLLDVDVAGADVRERLERRPDVGRGGVGRQRRGDLTVQREGEGAAEEVGQAHRLGLAVDVPLQDAAAVDGQPGRRRDADVDNRAARRPGEHDRERVERLVAGGERDAVALDDLREAVRLGHHDTRRGVVGHVGRDAGHVYTAVERAVQVALDRVGQDPAVAQQVVADHAVGRRRALHAEQVRAQASDHGGRPVGAGAEDEEAVVAGAAVGLHRLDVDEVDVQARPEDAGGREHEVVVELGSDDDHGVEAVAAVDVHRRVDGVLDQVGAGATAKVGQGPVVLLRAGQRERLDEEAVVAGVAVEVQRVQVVEDDEAVVADSTVDCHRLADAVAQPALGRVDRGEDVFGRDPRQLRRAP